MRYTREAVAKKAKATLDMHLHGVWRLLNSQYDFLTMMASAHGFKAIDALAPHTDGALIDVAVCIAKRDVDSPDSEFALKVSMGYAGAFDFQTVTIVVTQDGKVEIDTRDCYGPVIDALKEVNSG